MNRVFSADERPFSHIGIVAIVLRRQQPDGHHIGIVHRDGAAGTVQVLHLAWHHHLMNDARLDGWDLWVDVGLHPKRAVQVALKCRQVAKANGVFVPYAFAMPNSCFDGRTGAWLLSHSGQGLTCATFVIAVFKAAAVPILMLESWPERPDDRAWQERMIQRAVETHCPEDHVKGLRQQIGAVRFKPCEVGAAGALSPPPAEFSRAEALGVVIEERLIAFPPLAAAVRSPGGPEAAGSAEIAPPA